MRNVARRGAGVLVVAGLVALGVAGGASAAEGLEIRVATPQAPAPPAGWAPTPTLEDHLRNQQGYAEDLASRAAQDQANNERLRLGVLEPLAGEVALRETLLGQVLAQFASAMAGSGEVAAALEARLDQARATPGIDLLIGLAAAAVAGLAALRRER